MVKDLESKTFNVSTLLLCINWYNSRYVVHTSNYKVHEIKCQIV